MKYVLSLLIVLSVSLVAHAQVMAVAPSMPASAPADEPNVYRLTVTPAAEPQPTFKYTLVPQVWEREPGQSVPQLYVALDVVSSDAMKEASDLKVYDWLKMPPKDLPAEANALVQKFGACFAQLEIAGRRQQTDWGISVPRGQGIGKVISVPMPSLGKFRTVARVLALQARLQIAQGQYEQAIGTLQTGYAMAQKLSDQPYLITQLVAIAINAVLNQQVLTLQSAADSPNLYWALTQLPVPSVRLQESMEYEYNLFLLAYPELANPRQVPPQKWLALFDEFNRFSAEIGVIPIGPSDRKFEMLAGAIKAYPKAKQYLAGQGYTPQQIKDMPTQQVLGLYSWETYNLWRGRQLKGLYLPFWQAWPIMTKAAPLPEAQGNPFMLLAPSLHRAVFLATKADRQFAALRCIEAVRMYAAAHEGKLPATLADIAEAPCPIDPVTGKGFEYTVEGDTFTINCPPPSGLSKRDGDQYIVTMTSKAKAASDNK